MRGCDCCGVELVPYAVQSMCLFPRPLAAEGAGELTVLFLAAHKINEILLSLVLPMCCVRSGNGPTI